MKRAPLEQRAALQDEGAKHFQVTWSLRVGWRQGGLIDPAEALPH